MERRASVRCRPGRPRARAAPQPPPRRPAMPARVLIHVQHLLGIGHLKRAATLARGLAAAGLEVTLASGGLPVRGIDLGLARPPPPPPAPAPPHPPQPPRPSRPP